ncbi:MAG: asparagine synthase C-terminal domain-containing protein [Deltaproteobacteria bacterium]|nr:asparagine synthase C-terminal domain-containing protein [Deltaproteobacteria bacterium]
MIESRFSELRQKLTKALGRNQGQAILVSGGIDSGILSYLSPHSKGVTVSLDGRGEDLKYVSILADSTGLETTVMKVDVDEALSAVREVVKILRSFDPALPNDLAVYFGMREANKQGFESMMTGDGGDELFGGYPYMQKIEDLDGYIESIARSLQFSSSDMGKHFSLEVKQPFMDPEFVEFALTLGSDVKIREDNGHVWGKWILRKAFEPFLPSEFVWQGKRPLEVGSGMTHLRNIIASRISDEEFEEKKRAYPVKFLCKEHVFFYEIYREEVGEIPRPGEGEYRCSGCGGGVPENKNHCRICGWLP